MFDLREHKGLIRRLVSEANKNDANWHWSLKALSKTKASIFWSYLEYEGHKPCFVIELVEDDDGCLIYAKDEQQLPPPVFRYEFPADFYRSVQIPEVFPKDFQVKVPFQEGHVTVRAIEIHPDRTQTTEKIVEMPVKDGKICWENSGCLLAMVLERHGKNGNIGYGFLTGSCLREGTVATTYFHDHHNLFVAGNCPEDMLLAVKRIQELQGGFLTVKDGEILSELALPVCGLLSEKSIEENGLALKAVRKSLVDLGYVHNNPIMSVGTLGLPVSPALKLTDRGLVDVKKGEIVPLIVSEKRNK